MAPSSLDPVNGEGFVDEVEATQNQDFKEFQTLRQGRRISDLFSKDFVQFCKWLRNEVHREHSLAEFRRINGGEAVKDFQLISLVLLMYLALHFGLPAWTERLWGLPMFVYCMAVYRRQSFVHSRMHYISNMSGSKWLDSFVDAVMIIITGFSREAFYRRHIDEHLSHVSNMARVFGEDWQPFDDLPALWWLQPWKLVRLALNTERIKRDGFNERQLKWEAFALCAYLTLAVCEYVCTTSHFCLVYHMLPFVIVNSAILTSGMLTHSGVDARNSFNSCGLWDRKSATGLFWVSLNILEWLSDNGVSAHPIHHGYSQCPVPILLPRVDKINAHIIENFPYVRYNNLLSMEVHRYIYERIPPPRWYDYIVQTLVTFLSLALSTLTILGMPWPPILMEPALVDYRIYLYSTEAERCANLIGFWNSVNLLERAKNLDVRNGYLTFVVNRYKRMMKYLETHPHPIPNRLYAPDVVYEHNVWGGLSKDEFYKRIGRPAPESIAWQRQVVNKGVARS